MSKTGIGIALPGAAAMLSGVAAYVVKVPSPEAPVRAGLTYLPGETGRLPRESMTQLAQLPMQGAAWGHAAAGCVGIDQTFIATGTFTSTCTGTLTMESWGGGGRGPATYQPGGGGAFAESSGISVTIGQTWLANVAPSITAGKNGYISFVCPTAVGACTTGLGVCSGAGLTTANFVCAYGAIAATGGNGAAGVGATKFSGGSSSGIGGGAGGAAGPDGAGKNNVGSTGGAGDNGLGGAGGVGANQNGVSNPLGGGGGGYGGTTQGGAPGGGAYGNAGHGGRGQVRVHSDASDVLTPVQTGGSGYGGGTVSMT